VSTIGNSPSTTMRFFATLYALLGATFAAPVGPASTASSDRTLVERPIVGITEARRPLNLEISGFDFWISRSGRFQLSKVNLVLGSISTGSTSTTCHAHPVFSSKSRCVNRDFDFDVSKNGGDWTIIVKLGILRAKRHLALGEDVQKVEEKDGKQVPKIPPN